MPEHAPPLHAYDPFDPRVIDDPYPYYRHLRQHAPCYHSDARGIWVLSRYQDVRAALAVAGGTIPAGAKVMLLYGSANRDARKFEDPDAFRIERNPLEHLAFGFGPHTCLGAHLARLEARALLERVTSTMRSMRLEAAPVRTHNPLLRGMQSLCVSVQAR